MLTTVALFAFVSSVAQSYLGMESDNYSGIHGILSNPANVADSRLQSEINLVSGDALFGTDYFSITLSNALTLSGDFDFEEDLERFPSESNNFLANADIVGPSFMFNVGKKSSIGVVTRVRAMLNANNLNGELFENIVDEFDLETGFNFDMGQINTTTHAWGEIGLVYGRTLMDKEKNFLKGGVTFKYLLGGGVAQGNSTSISGNFDETQNLLTSSGNFAYNTSLDTDEDYSFDNITPGFGMDIGFVYEYRPDFIQFDPESEDYRGLNKYKFKIGFALTDMGSITYEDVETTNYNLNASIDATAFEDNDFDQVLEDNYTSTTTVEDVTIKLPSTLRINADYSFSKRFFTSINLIQSLNKEAEALANRSVNMFSITPRFESKVFSLYSPISFNDYGSVAMGVGFRLGPLMVGSSTALSNIFSKNAKLANLYAGLKIPVYQRSKIKKTSVKKRENNAK